MTGGDRLSDLGWEVRSAGGRWFLSIGELHAARRVMTWSYGGVSAFFYHISVCKSAGIFLNPRSSRNRQQCLKAGIANVFDLLEEMEKTRLCGIWTVKRQLPKIQCSSWPSPVLIFHLTHATSTPASAPCTVPVSTAHLSNLQRALSASCQPLGTGQVPCQNPQGQWLYYPALHPSLKATQDVTPGQHETLAKQLVCEGGCWGHRLSSAISPRGSSSCSVFTKGHFWARAHVSALLCGQPTLGAC